MVASLLGQVRTQKQQSLRLSEYIDFAKKTLSEELVPTVQLMWVFFFFFDYYPYAV